MLRARLRALAAAPLRFPVPLACAVLWAAVTIAWVHDDFGVAPLVSQLQVFLLIGLFASLAVKLFAESRHWPAWRWLALTAAALGLLALVVFAGEQPRNALENPALWLLGAAAGLLTIVAPYLRRDAEDRDVWAFNFGSWTSAGFGLVVAVGLGLGLAALLLALEALFGLDVWEEAYADVWIVCLSVVWPWQTLAGVPGGFGAAEQGQCPRWLAYLIGWLLVPIAVLYLAVLYAFAAKILVQWDLPEGQIGPLVAGFAAVGVAVWHVAHRLGDDGNRLVRFYLRWLHPALAVPVALLAVGIGVRVVEYGITEPRYGLMILTLWLAGLALYGTVARSPRLTVAPATLAALLMLASTGPLSATAVSAHSQLARLDAVLTEAGALADGVLSAPDGTVAEALEVQVNDIVAYLDHRHRRPALVESLRAKGLDIADDMTDDDIVAALGFQPLDYRGNATLYVWRRDGGTAFASIDTRGYDVLVRVDLQADEAERRPAIIAGAETELEARLADAVLEISTDSRGPLRIDVSEVVAALENDDDDTRFRSADDPLMTVTAEGYGLRVSVRFTSIDTVRWPESLQIYRLDFLALVGPSDTR